MKQRKSRERRKGRIEIIPMIDVMFFLLVTFMLASLSMQNLHSLHVNLPKGHATPTQTKTTVTLTVTDIHGNTSSCSSTVTVQDNIAPTSLCQKIGRASCRERV
jgi:biopolymer transport protein ExbD